jgi:hypothetical protein
VRLGMLGMVVPRTGSLTRGRKAGRGAIRSVSSMENSYTDNRLSPLLSILKSIRLVVDKMRRVCFGVNVHDNE